MQLNWVFLFVASLASLAACKLAVFVDPLPFQNVDDGILQNLTNNRRYKHGDIVRIRLSDGEHGDLSVWQLHPNHTRTGQEEKVMPLDHSKDSRLYTWRARYDMGRYLKNGEDAVYWFEMEGPGREEGKLSMGSTYFNVSMPNSWKSKPPVASKTTTLVRASSTSKSTTRPGPKSTATEKPSPKEKNCKEKDCKEKNCKEKNCKEKNCKEKNCKDKNCKEKNCKEKNYKDKNRKEKTAGARSGLTGGQVAGITIGAVAAFALILCGFCWGFDRMRVAKQLQKSHEFELRNMERDVRSLRETVSKLGA